MHPEDREAMKGLIESILEHISKLGEAIRSHLATKAESEGFPSSAFLATINNLKTSVEGALSSWKINRTFVP